MTPWQFLKRSAPRVLLAASVLSGAVMVTSPAGAVPIESIQTFEGFEQGGNQAVDFGATDWANASPANIPDDGVGYSVADEALPNAPGGFVCVNGGNSPNRSDLQRVYTNGPRLNGTDYILDLAWVRETPLDLITFFGFPIGDLPEAHVAFELNQALQATAPTPAPGNCPINRIAGDVLVSFDLRYSAFNPNPFISDAQLRMWDGDSWEDTDLPAGLLATGDDLIPGTHAVAGINDVNDPPAFGIIQDFPQGGFLAPGRFGEVTLNLSELGLVDNGCSTSMTLNARSRSSLGLDGTPADRFPSQRIARNDCGEIRIVKETVNPGVDHAFGFTGDLGAFPLNDGGAPGDTATFFRPAGAYNVSETLPVDGFDLTGLVCVDSDPQGVNSTFDPLTGLATVNLSAGELVTCTYTNTQRASVTITKDTVPDGPQDFEFNATGPNGFVDSATLDDDNDGTLSNTATRLLVPNPVGDPYIVTEEAVPGFALVDINCTLNGADLPIEAIGHFNGEGVLDGIEGNLPPGAVLDCTFVNEKLASVTIIKDTAPDGPQDFDFNATGPNGFVDSATLDDDADGTLSNTVTREVLANPVPADPYVVVEEAVPGFALVDIDCSLNNVPLPDEVFQVFNGDDLVGIEGNLNPGDNLVCTFSNDELASVTIIKDTQPNGPQDFVFNATGPDSFAASATLDDDADPTLPNSVTVDVLPNPEPAAPYVVTEQLVPGFELTDIDCFLNGAALPLEAIQVLDLDDNLIGVGGNLNPADDLVCSFVNDAQAGDLTVTVNADPDFIISPDPQGVGTFTLEANESRLFDDLPPGAYTVTMTDLDDDLVLEAIDCDPEETSFSLAGRSVSFVVVDDGAITCTFTVSEEDDNYNQYPGDNDFDFDTPFDDDDDPAPVVEVAGNTAGNNQNANPAPAEQPQAPVLETAAQPAPEAAPAVLDTLPRTGSGSSDLAVLGGLLMMAGVMAIAVGRLRRKASQA